LFHRLICSLDIATAVLTVEKHFSNRQSAIGNPHSCQPLSLTFFVSVRRLPSSCVISCLFHHLPSAICICLVLQSPMNEFLCQRLDHHPAARRPRQPAGRLRLDNTVRTLARKLGADPDTADALVFESRRVFTSPTPSPSPSTSRPAPPRRRLPSPEQWLRHRLGD